MNIPLNQTCLACGDTDYLKRVIVGETLPRAILDKMGIELEDGDYVLICFNCYQELGQ